jgi:hypothetical protein
VYRDSLFDNQDLPNLKSTISHQEENVKFWVCIVFIFVAALTLNAQNPDPVGQGLLDQANADRDSFGAGPDGSKRPTLEERAINAQSTLVLERSGIPWISPEESTPSLVGTTKGAEAYFDRALANSDLVVVGTIVRQTSTFNSTKRDIVTVSLFTVEDVVHSKPVSRVLSGDGIYIARPGGKMIVSGHTVQIIDDDFPEFSTGSRYLLFLTLDQKTHSYRVQSVHALLIQGNTITPVNPNRTHPTRAYQNSTNAFLEALRNRVREVNR